MRQPRKHSMDIRSSSIAFVVLVVFAQILVSQDRKLAQTGMKFLAVSSSARQSALGDAFTAAEGYSISQFYNPAGMARLSSLFDVSFSSTQWIADIKHQFAGFAISPESGLYGTIGFTAQYVDYGPIDGTIRANNERGYLDLGTFSPKAYVLGVGYARALSDKFAVGGNVRFVHQDLGNSISEATFTTDFEDLASGYSVVGDRANALSVFSFDFGILYNTGFKSLKFGMSIRNFSREVLYQKESFQLPLTFKIGLSMDAIDLMDIDPENQSLVILIDAEHPRDYPEQIRLGAEYVFAKFVAFRIGFVSPADERSVSYGLGIQQEWLGTQMAIDYSYTPFGVFAQVQTLSVRFGM